MIYLFLVLFFKKINDCVLDIIFFKDAKAIDIILDTTYRMKMLQVLIVAYPEMQAHTFVIILRCFDVFLLSLYFQHFYDLFFKVVKIFITLKIPSKPEIIPNISIQDTRSTENTTLSLLCLQTTSEWPDHP